MNSLLDMKDDFGTLHSSKVEKNKYILHHQSFWFIGRSTVCNWYKSGDKKTVRIEGIESTYRVFTYVLFSVTHSL